MPGIITPPNGTGSYNSGSSGWGSGNSYIGNYTNLPQGISNAGGGANNAYVRNVQPNELVSNQLNDITSRNDPYMQQARQSGLNVANNRGLLNSSIAAGNSTAAAINAALPIAQGNASAYGTAAGQNLDALNSILANTQNNQTSRANAAAAAGASMYNADLDYRLGLQNLDYQGQQAGLNRGFQDYMNRQNFGNQLRMGAFNLGSNLLNNNDQFTHSAYLNAMNNPFIMNDPQALQGYLDYGNQNNNSYFDDLWGFATNAGQPLGGWTENSPWYNSPSGSAPLPMWQGGY